MALRDADLASDFAQRFLFPALSSAQLVIASAAPASPLSELFYTNLTGGGSGPTINYVMRGYDSTLTTIVYWDSATIDPTAANYSGPGPVVDVVVAAVER